MGCFPVFGNITHRGPYFLCAYPSLWPPGHIWVIPCCPEIFHPAGRAHFRALVPPPHPLLHPTPLPPLLPTFSSSSIPPLLHLHGPVCTQAALSGSFSPSCCLRMRILRQAPPSAALAAFRADVSSLLGQAQLSGTSSVPSVPNPSTGIRPALNSAVCPAGLRALIRDCWQGIHTSPSPSAPDPRRRRRWAEGWLPPSPWSWCSQYCRSIHQLCPYCLPHAFKREQTRQTDAVLF